MTAVHATAMVDPRADLADDVVVGPYAIVDGEVTLSRGCILHAHAIVRGLTSLGPDNVVYSFAVIGGDPQSTRVGCGPSRVAVGQGNIFREHVTVHGGTEGRITRIGAGNLLMVGVHVAHDALIGSHCVFSNGAQLAGHAVVEDWVTFGGLSGVTQFVCVGESAFVAATTACETNVPPFVIVQGNRARVRGLNVVGLRRRGVPEESIRALRRAVSKLWLSSTTRAQGLRELEAEGDRYVRRLVAALRIERKLRP